MKTFTINEMQVNAILKYLMTKPMAEVEMGVNLLRSLPVAKAPEGAKTPPPKVAKPANDKGAKK